MENLSYTDNKRLDTSRLSRIGDLSYFEGPLLSLFVELGSGHFYVFDWVDRDREHNRWLIYRVSAESLLGFLQGKISHLALFEDRPAAKVFSMDIDRDNRSFSQYAALELARVPESYWPNADNFFERSDCQAFEKIMGAVNPSFSRQKSEIPLAFDAGIAQSPVPQKLA